MKNLIKRVQSRTCSNFAERENFGPLAKQKVFFILALLLMAATAHAEEVTGVTYLYYADQAAAIAQTPSTGTANCTKVEASSEVVEWNSGWYVVNEDVTISARIDVVGEVNLILADGAALTSTVCINTNGATLNIYGQALGTGTLNASSTNGPAAIGGRSKMDGGTLTIHGGIINATGGYYGRPNSKRGAAGIGGGISGGNGGTSTITCGTVTAKSEYGAAGIGGSAGAHCGVITINGGTVIATGPEDGGGPGIGNGLNYEGTEGQVIINGGTVTATGGTHGAGIGGGDIAYGGTVTITGGDVTAIGIAGAGIGGGSQRGGNVTITGGTVRAYSQDFRDLNRIGAGLCDGYNCSAPGTLTLGEEILVKAAQADETTDWEALPTVSRESFLADHSMRRVYIQPLKKLAETADNQTWLTENNAQKRNVILTRTLQTGGWNTFCAPFSTATPSGWTVKELTGFAFNSTTGELMLNFGNASGIEAGKPYLVKVTASVVNPVFEGVTISSTTTTTETTAADFVPVVNPTNLTGGDKTVLFIIGGNTLTYPENDGNINGFRAYFQLKGDAASLAHAFRMDFDDDVTGIVTVLSDEPTTVNGTYTLDGRRIEGQPTQKGVYIVNGKKTIIK